MYDAMIHSRSSMGELQFTLAEKNILLASAASSISVWQELVHVAAPISASPILDFMDF